MRGLIVVGSLLIGIMGNAQYKFKVKEHIAPVVLMVLAGASDGLNQSISFNYAGFKRHFPNANDKYWSPQLSFTRKYKDGDRSKGAAFPGSTNVLVFTTDAYHLTRFTEKLFIAGAISVKFTQDKKRWYVYILEAVGYWGANRIGFWATYNSLK